MANPSLAMIPSGYKATKLYSVLPADGVGDFDVSRASTATRVNSSGLIEEVGINVPRLDYSDGGCPVLLTEPQSTNLVTYSEDFSDSSWAKVGVSTLQNQGIAPDGLNTVNKIIVDNSNGVHYIKEVFSSNTGTKTASFFVDYTKNDFVSCSITYVANSRGVGIIINLTNNTILDTSINPDITYSLKIKTYGDFKRIEITATNTNENILNVLHISPFNNEAYSFDGGTRLPSYQGDGTSSVYIWGAQLEEQSYATSYIKTEGSTVTRNADVVGGAGDVTTFNSEEGVLYAEIAALSDDGTNRNITINGGTSNYIRIYYSPIPSQITYLVVSNGSVVVNIVANSVNQEVLREIVVTWKLNEFKFYNNGSLVGTDSSGITPIGLNKLMFSEPNGANNFFGKTQALKVYKSIADAQADLPYIN